MKAFRLKVGDKSLGDLAVANTNNASVIVGIDKDGFRFSVGGLTEPDEQGISWHYRWACPEIDVGTKIEIEIVDSDSCVPPTRMYRSDREVQEPAFSEEELRAMRYEDYLDLKAEFEP